MTGYLVRIAVGEHDRLYGMDHLYRNGVERQWHSVDAISNDKSEGHIRDLLKVLKNANQKFPGAKLKITLRNGLARKAVVLQKRNDKNGNEFWSVITSVPAQQNNIVNWGPFKPVKSPTLLDPAAATSAVSYYTSLPESLSQASVLGLPKFEWFNATEPVGDSQFKASTPRNSAGQHINQSWASSCVVPEWDSASWNRPVVNESSVPIVAGG